MLLTGPNMSGKSTYIRQAAIITLMAQIGSFVPASAATMGLVDRIFTRIGLQDDLSSGHSTFMVEMVETAAILNHATPRSLVILDEIGRGTSTYDGLAIAWAVAEHFHSNPSLGCKTFFATHYHELTELADYLPQVKNFNVAVTEEESEVIFLHQILPGSTNRSYGIHVARLAGLPHQVIQRAWEALDQLEHGNNPPGKDGQISHKKRSKRTVKAPYDETASQHSPQLSMFDSPKQYILQDILDIDISNLTPLQAINRLYEIQTKLKDK